MAKAKVLTNTYRYDFFGDRAKRAKINQNTIIDVEIQPIHKKGDNYNSDYYKINTTNMSNPNYNHIDTRDVKIVSDTNQPNHSDTIQSSNISDADIKIINNRIKSNRYIVLKAKLSNSSTQLGKINKSHTYWGGDTITNGQKIIVVNGTYKFPSNNPYREDKFYIVIAVYDASDKIKPLIKKDYDKALVRWLIKTDNKTASKDGYSADANPAKSKTPYIAGAIGLIVGLSVAYFQKTKKPIIYATYAIGGALLFGIIGSFIGKKSTTTAKSTATAGSTNEIHDLYQKYIDSQKPSAAGGKILSEDEFTKFYTGLNDKEKELMEFTLNAQKTYDLKAHPENAMQMMTDLTAKFDKETQQSLMQKQKDASSGTSDSIQTVSSSTKDSTQSTNTPALDSGLFKYKVTMDFKTKGGGAYPSAVAGEILYGKPLNEDFINIYKDGKMLGWVDSFKLKKIITAADGWNADDFYASEW